MSLGHQQASGSNKTQFDFSDGGWTNVLMSEKGCLLAFTVPIVAGPLMSMGHTAAIYFDLILRSLSPRNHAVLSASSKWLWWGLRGLIIFPFVLALISIAPKMSQFDRFCFKPWSLPFWCILVTTTALLLLLVLAIYTSNLVIQNRRRKYLWPANVSDSSELIPTRSSMKRKQQARQNTFHSAKSAGSNSVSNSNSKLSSQSTTQNKNSADQPVNQQMTTMLVQTVDPPPCLSLSLTSVALLNFVANLIMFLPMLIHMYPHHEDQNEPFLRARSDVALSWSHLLVLASSAFNPVMNLMSDEALSSLGLDLIRKSTSVSTFSLFSTPAKRLPPKPKNNFAGQAAQQHAYENQGFEEN